MKVYCMTVHKNNKTTAGAKAPDDISLIAGRMGAEELIFKEAHKFKNIKWTRFFSAFVGIRNWTNLLFRVKKNSYVIIQHPNENILIANKFINLCKKTKKVNFIFLIHDMESLRKNLSVNNGEIPEGRGIIADEVLLKKADYIICHNKAMRRYLVSRGFNDSNIVELEIFDYLHDCQLPTDRKMDNSIIIAGNLMKEKVGYLYKLLEKNELDIVINLYGPNYTGSRDMKNINYCGQCRPEELPEKLRGSFGLVWDGTEIDGCHGKAGEYIRYNNPHKCSLFLASNIPVIIWKEAALAEFVEKKGVGITIDSLSDINEKISQVTNEQYKTMVLNTIKVGKELREGHYFKTALKKILDRENV